MHAAICASAVTDEATLKSITIGPRAAARLQAGHPWIYRSDVVTSDALEMGEPVVVQPDGRRKSPPLGTAFSSTQSIIAARLASRVVEPLDAAFVRRRLQEALEVRRRMGGALPSAFRWVHGESDGLPGLVVDRMGDALAVQVLSQGTHVLQEQILAALVDLGQPKTLVLRNDVPVRAKEGLPLEKRVVLGTNTAVEFLEGDIKLRVDLMEGQKTGTFLDQRENHVLAGRLAFGRGLDCFSGDGGFALQLARNCAEVEAVDSSASACERITENARLNGLTNVRATTENAFDLLRARQAGNEMYDTIVVDPPAFAKSKQHLDAAYRGYKELNLRAMKMLRRGGILVTCSCSHAVTPVLFEDMLRDAAADAQRDALVLMRRGAGADHPVRLGFPESEYLKCVILRIV